MAAGEGLDILNKVLRSRHLREAPSHTCKTPARLLPSPYNNHTFTRSSSSLPIALISIDSTTTKADSRISSLTLVFWYTS